MQGHVVNIRIIYRDMLSIVTSCTGAFANIHILNGTGSQYHIIHGDTWSAVTSPTGTRDQHTSEEAEKKERRREGEKTSAKRVLYNERNKALRKLQIKEL